jgi:hypothetical protein
LIAPGVRPRTGRIRTRIAIGAARGRLSGRVDAWNVVASRGGARAVFGRFGAFRARFGGAVGTSEGDGAEEKSQCSAVKSHGVHGRRPSQTARPPGAAPCPRDHRIFSAVVGGGRVRATTHAERGWVLRAARARKRFVAERRDQRGERRTAVATSRTMLHATTRPSAIRMLGNALLTSVGRRIQNKKVFYRIRPKSRSAAAPLGPKGGRGPLSRRGVLSGPRVDASARPSLPLDTGG